MMVMREVYSDAIKKMPGTDRASGDDIFMIQQVNGASTYKMGFCKSPLAMVETFSEPSWIALIRQRLRWSSKNAELPHTSTKVIGLLVFLNSLLIFTHIVMIWVWGPIILLLMLIHMTVKSCSEYYLISAGCDFSERNVPTRIWLISFLINPIMIVFPVILSIIPYYTWKGRKVR